MTSILERHPSASRRAPSGDVFDDSSWFGAEAHVVADIVPPAKPALRTLADDLDDPEWLPL